MREQAHLIQEEVIRLMEDVDRLDDRVRRLQMHFGQANKDIDDIFVSTKKVTKSGQRISSVEFDAPVAAKRAVTAAGQAPANGPELPFNGLDDDEPANPPQPTPLQRPAVASVRPVVVRR